MNRFPYQSPNWSGGADHRFRSPMRHQGGQESGPIPGQYYGGGMGSPANSYAHGGGVRQYRSHLCNQDENLAFNPGQYAAAGSPADSYQSPRPAGSPHYTSPHFQSSRFSHRTDGDSNFSRPNFSTPQSYTRYQGSSPGAPPNQGFSGGFNNRKRLSPTDDYTPRSKKVFCSPSPSGNRNVDGGGMNMSMFIHREQVLDPWANLQTVVRKEKR